MVKKKKDSLLSLTIFIDFFQIAVFEISATYRLPSTVCCLLTDH